MGSYSMQWLIEGVQTLKTHDPTPVSHRVALRISCVWHRRVPKNAVHMVFPLQPFDAAGRLWGLQYVPALQRRWKDVAGSRGRPYGQENVEILLDGRDRMSNTTFIIAVPHDYMTMQFWRAYSIH